MTLLDFPVWSSLTTNHLDLSEGDDFARRYVRGVNLFASACDDSPFALDRLAALVNPGERIYVLQAPPVAIPRKLTAIKQADGVQMIDTGQPLPEDDGELIEPLGDRDAEDMLALATLTEPGPFRIHTNRMGDYFGIRVQGRLVAMAGERFRFPGYTEVSGVCTHPDFRGRGFARRLSAHVTAAIRRRGDTPFLHAWKANTPAITLYGSLGFALRSDLHIAVLANE